MNERIKELAQQVDSEFNSPYDRHKAIERFAELIVQECLDQCYNRGMNDLQLLYAGQLKAAAYIEQHFGIEE